MLSLSARDQRLSWLGLASLEPVPDGFVPWRLPHNDSGLYPAGLAAAATVASGVRVRFTTDSTILVIEANSDHPESVFDVFVGDDLVASPTVASLAEGATIRLSAKDDRTQKSVTVWLPNVGHVTLKGFELAADATLLPWPSYAPLWLAYGSSITQSRFASQPSDTWLARVASQHGSDFHCLGFASAGLLDPVVAKWMASTACDHISLEVGVSVYTESAMSLPVYFSSLVGFIATLRSAHPETPIVVVSPIASPSRESTPTWPRLGHGFARRLVANQLVGGAIAGRPGYLGPTLSQIRELTHETVNNLIAQGDQNLNLVDGRNLLAISDAGLLSDGIHPGPGGEKLIAARAKSLLFPAQD